MSFLNTLERTTNKSKLTQNGALTNASSLDPVLDYFSLAGAMRGRPADAVKLFHSAYNVDPLMAVRCLFYLRDVRGGQGERNIFRQTLESLDASLLKKIVRWIPEFGRWDDMPINEFTAKCLLKKLKEDEKEMAVGNSVSLLAKWLPSENTSSKKTVAKANQLINFWGITPRSYRKRVSTLRKYIVLLEQKMSAKQWSLIDYSKLPSQAHRKHTKAFTRNDEARYNRYLQDVANGKAKINTSTIYTYELYDNIMKNYQPAHEEMWKNLPDFTNSKNALVIADTSASMTWTHNPEPMSVAISLAVYFAERNKGAFANCFMTFSDTPNLIRLNKTNIREKFNQVLRSPGLCGSTNIQAAFDAILNAAIASNSRQDEIPSTLYILSDMEFNIATSANNETNFEAAQRKFKSAGYELPHVVFWNLDAKTNQAPATKYDNRVTLISGSSQATFKYAVEGKTPLESMNEVLNGPRYSEITL